VYGRRQAGGNPTSIGTGPVCAWGRKPLCGEKREAVLRLGAPLHDGGEQSHPTTSLIARRIGRRRVARSDLEVVMERPEVETSHVSQHRPPVARRGRPTSSGARQLLPGHHERQAVRKRACRAPRGGGGSQPRKDNFLAALSTRAAYAVGARVMNGRRAGGG